ncbi:MULTISPECIES: FtsW/RodA/SpoVE family cell cycle protein [unclassified Sporolactobacillus]|uniref:FtsW/RodA/SpoVE family cell cycle protein n=1 Tax=unclassified Sporolactobacillus TaxID=2628533 RepID=UPI002367721D|nr:FtsW/RodA/SpoVE family cell cycle protein [Sporolactobacillus sp. CQH2019]MDD9147465.1 FtsW/RodA/SpoVE family cell cycle protein [Sporolactobacillus sp. CQH2019]
MDYYIKQWLKHLDWAIIISLLLLAVFSTVALFSSTYGKFNPTVPAQIIPKQILFEILGFIAMIVTAKFDYGALRKNSKWLYGISIFLLLVVFVMPRQFGAHSWIPLGIFAFQPSEFAKLTLIIAVAGYMANIDESEIRSRGFKQMAAISALFIVPFLLTLKEPALGQALVLFAIVYAMSIIFARRSHFTLLTLGFLLVVFGFTVLALDFPQQSTNFIENVLVKHNLLQSFQADRVVTWLNPSYDPSGAGYNVQQAQIAVGSSEVFGDGFLKGVETRAGMIPNQTTDFIFTAIAEQFGFIGSALLVLVFLILIQRLMQIAAMSLDPFGTYLVTGIIGMFAFQIFENVGMDIYLSPATGITLPFISYGGSSLIANYIAVGLALSVYHRSKSIFFTVSGSASIG